ncbi:argininosuccinate synthase, partial [Patescibacteria group bacterium]|nr:argininosuccinate synthase [Patescibacteria group bacterium]
MTKKVNVKDTIFQQSNYIKVATHEGKKSEVKKIVLLYSGGLDTSCMLKWLQDEYQCELITLTIDYGQQLEGIYSL